MWGIFGVHTRMWFNTIDGWTSESDRATRYTWAEKQDARLPFGSVWSKLPINSKISTGFKGAA